MKWAFAFGLLVLVGLGFWLAPSRSEVEAREIAGSTAPTRPHDIVTEPKPIGTSGDARAVATDGVATDSVADEQGVVIREIETITGANDGMALIGRRVDLHVDVQDLVTNRAFWVGSRDNRVLVVLGRDEQHRAGRTSGHRITPVHHGQLAAISGVIRPLPNDEQMHGWNLTAADRTEVADRKIYIRADTVSSKGHGAF